MTADVSGLAAAANSHDELLDAELLALADQVRVNAPAVIGFKTIRAEVMKACWQAKQAIGDNRTGILALWCTRAQIAHRTFNRWVKNYQRHLDGLAKVARPKISDLERAISAAEKLSVSDLDTLKRRIAELQAAVTDERVDVAILVPEVPIEPAAAAVPAAQIEPVPLVPEAEPAAHTVAHTVASSTTYLQDVPPRCDGEATRILRAAGHAVLGDVTQLRRLERLDVPAQRMVARWLARRANATVDQAVCGVRQNQANLHAGRAQLVRGVW